MRFKIRDAKQDASFTCDGQKFEGVDIHSNIPITSKRAESFIISILTQISHIDHTCDSFSNPEPARLRVKEEREQQQAPNIKRRLRCPKSYRERPRCAESTDLRRNSTHLSNTLVLVPSSMNIDGTKCEAIQQISQIGR